MKINILLIVILILWVSSSVLVGYYASVVIQNIGANHITPSDIIACYSLPFIFLGIAFSFLFFYLAQKL